MKNATGLHEMLAYIAVQNSEGTTHKNYLLSETLYRLIDSADGFRNEQFRNFFTKYIKPERGNILLPAHSGQYVFLLLSKQDTLKLKGKSGRYISVALFSGNAFAGFEEGIITERGIEVLPDGFYASGMDVGGFISFVIIALAYKSTKSTLPLADTPGVRETIYSLS